MEHINSENEKVSIHKLEKGHKFENQFVLVIHDDPKPHGSGVQAPMLLDSGTMDWLVNTIIGIKNGNL